MTLKYSIEDQTLALAGIIHASMLVQQIAQQGTWSEPGFETAVKSLFNTNPANVADVYGGMLPLKAALQELVRVLDKQTSQKDIELVRYTLSMVHLESKLRKRPDLLDTIGKRVEQSRHQLDHFGPLHTQLMSNLASLYTDTISTFSLRIQVHGQPKHLRVDDNAARIRSALLAGIRSAVLWRQAGGRRWHLVFYRRRVVDAAKRLLVQISSTH